MKKKANKAAAKEAKTLNRFENNGDFLRRYLTKSTNGGEDTLGKREQPDRSESEGDSEERASESQPAQEIEHRKKSGEDKKLQSEASANDEIPEATAGELPRKLLKVDEQESHS